MNDIERNAPITLEHTSIINQQKYFIDKVTDFYQPYKRTNEIYEVGGLYVSSPVGLAAGYDKDAEHLNSLNSFGFGWITIGSVTYDEREGNPEMHTWATYENGVYQRHPSYVHNRMGLPSKDNKIIYENIRKFSSFTPVVLNMYGESVEEYMEIYRTFASLHCIQAFEINLQCPNKEFTLSKDDFAELMDKLNFIKDFRKIWVKFPFNSYNSQLVDICKSTGVDALVVSNSKKKKNSAESGRRIFPEMLAKIPLYANHGIPVIACGGVTTADDFNKVIDAGAVGCDVFTSFVSDIKIVKTLMGERE